MVRSMWMPVTSGVAMLCVGTSLWPQLATTAAGLSLFGASNSNAMLTNPIDALLERLPPFVGRISGASSVWSSTDQELQDLRVGNLSVHRIRYERGQRGVRDDETDAAASTTNDAATDSEPLTAHDKQDHDDQHNEETVIRSLFGSAWAAASSRNAAHRRISSVVVTWEDHRIADESRPASQTMCGLGGEDDTTTTTTTCHVNDDDQKTTTATPSGREVVYEVQMWVNGWGFDAFWHPANRRISTSDPFIVLSDLPLEQELGFRIRMKVKTTTGLLSGFFATEVEGPWSHVVTLSPSKEQAVEAIVSFFRANKTFGVVVAFLIGLSVLIILRLVVSYVLYGKHGGRRSPKRTPHHHHHHHQHDDGDAQEHYSVGRQHDDTTTGRRRVLVDLEQEVIDLRQELADSEAEVHRLMLFRGYGIDTLSEKELLGLEQNLRHSLELVQKKRRRSGATPSASFESTGETEDDEDHDDDSHVEMGQEGAGQLGGGNDGVLRTVFEADDE